MIEKETDLFRDFQRLILLEPTAREVQEQVVAYANADPSKIKKWHYLAKLRTLLPDVSFGRDFSRSNNIDLDRGSTSVADRYISGPEDRAEGFDFDVSWDLGDLIFNTSQTSIDSREKSMVYLRQDLLEEATRIFYERRQLQLELIFSENLPELTYYQKIVELEEHTSQLDALTNGFMEKRLKEIYRENPELMKLWLTPVHGQAEAARMLHQFHGRPFAAQ